jgi:glucosamine--fructose-6-phosphate aminotransferase (isomerizing)
MCGVFGYVGAETNVGATILTALKTLEYRGYDSWGMALAGGDALIVDKSPGRINGHRSDYPAARMGIGHTRWATHGGVTKLNAHPHVDEARRIAVVHNGIIENYQELKTELLARGHIFASETDSEVIVHLVEEGLQQGRPLPEAVNAVFRRLDGYNAIVVFDRNADQIVAIKRVSPLVAGRGVAGSIIASDAIAMHGHAEELVYLEDDQLAILASDSISLFDSASMQPLSQHVVAMHAVEDVTLGHFPHFMIKEITEQPATLRRLLTESREEIEALACAVDASNRVLLVGCGTAANAALAGVYLFSEIAGRDVSVIPASEFRYRTGYLDDETLVIAISQSGETIDVLEAMRAAQQTGSRTAAIVNTPNSSLDRMVEVSVHLRSGVEQCVLATKSYTAMLATLLLTACQTRGRWDEGAVAVARAANVIETMLVDETTAQLQELGAAVANQEHLFPIGRGVHYASSLEAALKVKEVSYVHAEGFAAGELKHGVIALIDQGTPCLVFAPSDQTRVDVLSGAAELKSRGGFIIGIGSEQSDVFDAFIRVPDVGLANSIAEALPGQFLGYYAALARGNDPDRPRNLAKSVTVK